MNPFKCCTTRAFGIQPAMQPGCRRGKGSAGLPDRRMRTRAVEGQDALEQDDVRAVDGGGRRQARARHEVVAGEHRRAARLQPPQTKRR